MTDDQIRRHSGIEPHQQVNQICRRLAADGQIVRRPRRDGMIVNLAVSSPDGMEDSPVTRDVAGNHGPAPRPEGATSAASWVIKADPQVSLLVLPCSARKAHHAVAGPSGVGATSLLPQPLASELSQARHRNTAQIGLDESSLVPAIHVYDGTLYQEGRGGIVTSQREGAHVAIISGGYGLVMADEPIGRYDQVFRPSMWPRRLVGRCLADIAGQLRVARVLGFLSSSTAYAEVFRSAPWPESVDEAVLVSPQRSTAGAQVKAPRALGQALVTLSIDGGISSSWRSSDGLRLEPKNVL